MNSARSLLMYVNIDETLSLPIGFVHSTHMTNEYSQIYTYAKFDYSIDYFLTVGKMFSRTLINIKRTNTSGKAIYASYDYVLESVK